MTSSTVLICNRAIAHLQADTHFMNDTGLSFPEMQAFHAAYARNMETLYDNIVAQGG